MSPWLFPVLAGVVREEHGPEIISPAYDLFTPAQRGAHARRYPRSFLNGTPSEGDDPELDLVGRRDQASEYLERELAAGTWTFRPPSLYVLELRSGDHRQVGIVGDVPRDRFPTVIKPHETTRPDRVHDLVDYLARVGFSSSPVGLAYRRSPTVDEITSRICGRQPIIDVTLPDGDRQRVWVARDDDLFEALATVVSAYIIDGHHRVAATIERGLDPETPGGRFLAVAFPSDDLAVYPFHRWLDIPIDEIGAQPGPLQPQPGFAVAVTRAGEWLVDLGTGAEQTDVAALANGILASLGVEDERTDPRLRFVPGFPDDQAIRGLVGAEGGVGFLLSACPIEKVLAVSDRRQSMPPKATYFSPKPRSGLFLVRR